VLCFVVIAFAWVAFDRIYPQASVRGEREMPPLQ